MLIASLPSCKHITHLRHSSTFRYKTYITSSSTFRYGNAKFVDERHRHRYEVIFQLLLFYMFFSFEFSLKSLNVKYIKFWQVNPDMISEIEKAGLSFVGKDETGRRMEVICSWRTCLMCDSM